MWMSCTELITEFLLGAGTVEFALLQNPAETSQEMQSALNKSISLLQLKIQQENLLHRNLRTHRIKIVATNKRGFNNYGRNTSQNYVNQDICSKAERDFNDSVIRIKKQLDDLEQMKKKVKERVFNIGAPPNNQHITSQASRDYDLTSLKIKKLVNKQIPNKVNENPNLSIEHLMRLYEKLDDMKKYQIIQFEPTENKQLLMQQLGGLLNIQEDLVLQIQSSPIKHFLTLQVHCTCRFFHYINVFSQHALRFVICKELQNFRQEIADLLKQSKSMVHSQQLESLKQWDQTYKDVYIKATQKMGGVQKKVSSFQSYNEPKQIDLITLKMMNQGKQLIKD